MRTLPCDESSRENWRESVQSVVHAVRKIRADLFELFSGHREIDKCQDIGHGPATVLAQRFHEVGVIGFERAVEFGKAEHGLGGLH